MHHCRGAAVTTRSPLPKLRAAPNGSPVSRPRNLTAVRRAASAACVSSFIRCADSSMADLYMDCNVPDK